MFLPYNRRLLVEPVAKSEEESLVLLPESQSREPTHSVVKLLSVAPDCEKFNGSTGQMLVVESPMIEELDLFGEKHSVILENYVVGVYFEESEEQ